MAVAAEPTRANYIEKNRSNNQTRDVQLRQSCFGKSRIYKPYSLRCERSRQTKWNLKTTSGKSIRADILPKTKFEIVIDEEDVKKATDIIVRTACTDTIGDGKIFVSTIDDAIRIRTGEKGTDAI